MNVALVHKRYTEQGGTERFLVGLARFLLRRGHEVHVYSSVVDPRAVGAVSPIFHPLRELRLGLTMRRLSLWWTSWSARAGGHDVVMGFGRTRGHEVFRAGGGAHAAYLQAVRRGWWLDPAAWIERALDRRAVLGASRVVAPSRVAAADLVRCYGLPADRVIVVNNGVDSARFRPDAALRRAGREALGLGSGPVLGFLGTGFRRKGLSDAIEVAAELQLPLVVLGTDARLRRWRRRFPDVRFLGAVPDPERWLPAMDVLLLPTRYEPYGNACLEAMACGVVPITSSCNGVAEVFPVPGLVADAVPALCQATRRALADREGLARACRSRAMELNRERAYAAVESSLLQEAGQ